MQRRDVTRWLLFSALPLTAGVLAARPTRASDPRASVPSLLGDYRGAYHDGTDGTNESLQIKITKQNKQKRQFSGTYQYAYNKPQPGQLLKLTGKYDAKGRISFVATGHGHPTVQGKDVRLSADGRTLRGKWSVPGYHGTFAVTRRAAGEAAVEE